MFTVFLVHSRQDRPVARELAGFIERGLSDGVLVDPGEIGEDEDLLAKTGEGLAAQAMIVLLSPDSAPSRWVRDEWVPALIDEPLESQVPVAFVRSRGCKVPDLLRRGKFFELDPDPLAASRALKQWLLDLQGGRPDPLPAFPRPSVRSEDPELETLRRTLADQPGSAVIAGPGGSGKTTLALQFAARHDLDFECVFWLPCSGRSAAGILGDLAAQLGLRLDADTDASARTIQNLLEARRFLLILDDAGESARSALPSGGKTSVLLTARCPELFEDAAPLRIVRERAGAKPPMLYPDECALVDAMSACAPSGFPLALAAAIARTGEGEAAELARALVDRGLVLGWDGGRWALPRAIRETWQPEPESRLRHAEAVAALLARSVAGTFADYGNAQHALEWCFRDPDDSRAWELGYDIAWRAGTLARNNGRMPEAFELFSLLLASAERQDDRQWQRSALQEMVWILGSQGKAQAAAECESDLRSRCDDQLWLPFMTA